MLLQKQGRQYAIPFGPFLAFGALAYLFFGPQLIDWYLSLGRP
jgi:leader peptidase (prepilin peptidase)/N-methyltransferase